jgi:uncharacterized protein
MQRYIDRNLETLLSKRLRQNPAVALLGPRQVGKSTLAKKILNNAGTKGVYLDLEKPSDLNKLRAPEEFFSLHNDKLICLDEIQRQPDLFPLLRNYLDENGKNGRLLLLGSASRDLIQQSSETLAGRISFLEMAPFQINEIGHPLWKQLWLRGGFPRSFLADDLEASIDWRLNFIQTFLERDLPQLGFRIPSQKIQRFWKMCAHAHGQVLNSSQLGSSLSVSYHTIRSYIDILEETFILRTLPPYSGNLKKRLIKSPKIYIRDSGLLHSLLAIENHDDLFAHPTYGPSFEGFVIENISNALPLWQKSFYRTSSGNEIDLILEKGNQKVAIEIKASSSFKISKGFWTAQEDLAPDQTYIIAPVNETYPIEKGVIVTSLEGFLSRM